MLRLVGLAATAWLSLQVPQVAAADVEVDLELVLAVDVSRSMDFDEQRLQRDGYIAAFNHPEVIQAITSGNIGQIAVTYFEWAGPGFQTMIAPWTLIASAEDAAAFAAQLAAGPISRETGTSISSGLFFAVGRFKDNGFSSYRSAIDISGDGPNNAGSRVDETRDWVVDRGITINGLPIMLKPDLRFSAFGMPNLDIYYEDCVIGGPGAFMIAVTDPMNFEAAIRRKLVLEIAGLPARVIPAAEVLREPRVDCSIGERSRRNLFEFR
jgi:hypothetical protein